MIMTPWVVSGLLLGTRTVTPHTRWHGADIQAGWLRCVPWLTMALGPREDGLGRTRRVREPETGVPEMPSPS